LTKAGDQKEALGGARVIVTGASGFIGLHLVKALRRLNANVLVIDRVQPAEHIPHVEFEWADLRHLNKVYDADYLIHLAAITNAGYAERYPLETYEVNVLGTVNLLNHVRVKQRVLFPSTALIYKASELPINEEAEEDLSSTYAQSKIIGEQLTRFLCGRMGVSYTIVRFFNIFGPGQLSMYIVPQVLRQILEDKRVVLRNGSVTRDLLYVEDCIDAVLKLVVTPLAVNSVFNIGSGRKVSISDVAKVAVEVSGTSGIEIADKQETITYSPTAIIADIGKVRSTISWRPKTSLKEGLQQMWQSYSSGK
jgi:nucleoside-diphosphate-sugar epimerase